MITMTQAMDILDDESFAIRMAIQRQDNDCYTADEVIDMLESVIAEIRAKQK